MLTVWTGSGANTNLKAGKHTSGTKRRPFFCSPPLFSCTSRPTRLQLVVFVSAFVMVSTVWSVSCLLFFSTHGAQPFLKVGDTCPVPHWVGTGVDWTLLSSDNFKLSRDNLWQAACVNNTFLSELPHSAVSLSLSQWHVHQSGEKFTRQWFKNHINKRRLVKKNIQLWHTLRIGTANKPRRHLSLTNSTDKMC